MFRKVKYAGFGFIVCLGFLLLNMKSYGQQFSRQNFYKTMAGKSLADIDNQLAALEQASLNVKEGFEGALLMKKADLVENKKEKLNLFKSGKSKLETVIAKDTANAEFRFLRLQIQEHAPKAVKYRDNMGSDKAIIIRFFKSLPAETQQAITDYSKQSKILLPSDL